MSLPKYPEYKDSGSTWLGHVPSHWVVAPVGSVARIVNGYPFDASKFSATDGFPVVRIRDLNREETSARYGGAFVEAAEVTRADVLIGMDGDFNVGRWLGSERALLNQRMCAVRGRSRSVSRLLEYALPIPLKAINEVTFSTTVKHLSANQVEKTRVAIPPTADELEKILTFLDRETAKIDALIEEQERLVALLDEKRQAVITQAVTKGLDPNVPMKDSGVEWIGEVPADWKVPPLRQLARLESGHTPSRQRPEWWQNCTIPWFTLSDIWQVREESREVIHKTSERVSELGLANSSARLLPEGTVMLSRTASVGFAAVMGQPMATSQDFANWVCGPDLSPSFLLRVFQAMAPEFERLKFGSTHNTIYMPDIAAFRCPAPPRPEQERIVAYLQDELNSIRSLRESSLQATDLLRERRAALISAAVTGQIDVRSLVDAEAE